MKKRNVQYLLAKGAARILAERHVEDAVRENRTAPLFFHEENKNYL